MDRDQRITAELDGVAVGGNLYELAVVFKHEGMKQHAMYELFDSFRAKYEVDVDETKYNAILDTMDFISGNCNSNNALFSDKL